MSTFHTTTGKYLNDGSIEGAGSTFTITTPITITADDFGGTPGKFSLVVSQKNAVSPATGKRIYNGGAIEDYSVRRTGTLCSGSHGIPDSKAFPSLDGHPGIVIEPKIGTSLTFFKQFTKA